MSAGEGRPVRVSSPNELVRLLLGSMLMPRLNSRTTWYALTSGAFAIALVFLSTMLLGKQHVWSGALMIVAYCLSAVAVVAGVCGQLGVRFPVLGDRPAKPSFPVLPDPPADDDSNSELRQALEVNRSELGEALAASGTGIQLHDFCDTCGYPFGRPLVTAVCVSQTACAKRLQAPVARRLQVGRTLAVDPRWVARHIPADH